jgi:hypothetical protein
LEIKYRTCNLSSVEISTEASKLVAEISKFVAVVTKLVAEVSNLVAEVSKLAAEWSVHILQKGEVPVSTSPQRWLLGCNPLEFVESPTIRRKSLFHHQGAGMNKARNSRRRKQGVSLIFLLELVLVPASGDMFVRNFGLTPNSVVLNSQKNVLHHA